LHTGLVHGRRPGGFAAEGFRRAFSAAPDQGRGPGRIHTVLDGQERVSVRRRILLDQVRLLRRRELGRTTVGPLYVGPSTGHESVTLTRCIRPNDSDGRANRKKIAPIYLYIYKIQKKSCFGEIGLFIETTFMSPELKFLTR